VTAGSDDAGDARLSFVFDEAKRALVQQLDRFDGLRARAGMLFSAASVAASLVGGVALRGSERPSAWTWVGIGCYGAVAALTVALVWPVTVTAENDAAALLTHYVDDGATLDEMRRDLATHMAGHFAANKRRLDRLYGLYQWMIAAMGAEIIVLLVDLRGRA
jgi:hypothetical protein